MKFRIKTAWLTVLAALVLSGCTYVKNMGKQTRLRVENWGAPAQSVNKHLIGTEKFFLFGRLVGIEAPPGRALAVVALSDRYQRNEIVDVNYVSRMGVTYALHLPAGDYRLLVLCDFDGDGFFDGQEIAGERRISLGEAPAAEKVIGGIDLAVGSATARPGVVLRLGVPPQAARAESLFYPRGSLRSLDDPIFSPRMARLGLYEPAAFLEAAPMMFYALEEDESYKIPVVFVHGIDGTARDFETMVAGLDRTRYRFWFFYYPSGGDLAQFGELFYKVFLSGETIPLAKANTPLAIVAHSMGGLVVREALNHCTGAAGETQVAQLITISSPMGGHPAAKAAVNAPLAVPAWRDLVPDSAFIKQLHRRPLPAGVNYHLYYSFGNPGTLKLGENSDGVVPLSSQLVAAAQNEAAEQRGFNDNHTDILRNPEAIARIAALLAEVKPPLPEAQLALLRKGGYAVELGSHYTPMEQYAIHHLARYLEALASGLLVPTNPAETHFVDVCQGRAAPASELDTGWLKFMRDHPDRSRWCTLL
jgi:triacylglycerol esterase/lipase EstA (alpha/beta hydrolase family)